MSIEGVAASSTSSDAPGATTFRLVAFAMAFCSMAYELVLAQSATVLYGGTILRYSTMIGLFIVSLGLGAAYWAWRTEPPRPTTFWWIELTLSLVGLASPMLVFALEPLFAHGDLELGFAAACLAAFVIGWLSGMELPVLIALALPTADDSGQVPEGTRRLVGLDFLGTFVAGLIVPVVLYPALGLVGSVATAGILNSLVAVVALRIAKERSAWRWAATCLSILLAALCCLERQAVSGWLSERAF
jgi:spermidine synthase